MAELETTEGVRQLHRIFLEDVYGIPGGEKIRLCQQCGTCTGSCPTSYLMDYGPREVIAFFRAGMIEKVVKSNTIWLCTSCYYCTVRCPAGIKITDIMYELKRLAIKYRSWPEESKNPALSTIFIHNVEKYGRNYELGLMARYILAKDWSLPFKFARTGMKLFAAGRFPLRPKSIKGTDELARILKVLESKEVAQ